MKIVFLYTSIALTSGILFINIYNSLVDARAWGSNIPESLRVARGYTANYSPATFFKVFGPIQLVLAGVNMVLFWSLPAVRWYLLAALLILLLTDLLTVKYFFSRNDIMFRSGFENIDALKKAYSEWTFMNWIRSAMVFAALVLTTISLHTVYKNA